VFEGTVFSRILCQVLLMSTSSSKFTKTGNLCQMLTRYYSLNSSSLSFVTLNLPTPCYAISHSVKRLGYGLDDRNCMIRFAAGARNFSHYHRIQTGSGANPVSYPIGTGGGALSLGVKRPEREADQSPPSSAEVKKVWSYTSTP
jgi:hypothetical protein